MKLINMRRSTVNIFVLLAGLCAAPAVQAQGAAGGYFGASIGQASVSDFCSDTVGLTSCDDSDRIFKIFGGARITPNFGIEAAYLDLGTASATVDLGVPVTVDFELTGFAVQGVGIVPFGNEFSLMGRVGIIFWDTTARAGTASANVSDTGTDIALGAGAEYKFSRNFGMRADFDFYPELGNNDTGEDDVTAISIGAVFSF